MANTRKKINPTLVLAVHLRSDFRCCYCGCDLRNARPYQLTIEHVRPHSLGGLDTADNLVTACFPCNRGRSNKPLAAYATPGARLSIRRTLRRKINLPLAAALRRGTTGANAL